MKFQGVELSTDLIWPGVFLGLIICVLIGVYAWWTLDAPPSFLERWAAHAKRRDGKAFTVGVGVLLVVMGVGSLSFFMGLIPSKVAAIFIGLLPIVFSWVVIFDIWKFWQAERKHSK